ncbi:DNA polymerase beta superfamily protein [Aquibacillus albus]|uniref:Nucleotidyltransferase n=1 Tax=Aquibacillus albus TaxID=1168171 RepID=A0ABS2N2N2_9BACI|nr:nucleotidyltransferase domain-containing protein [Aquibacillus albus]MBM7572318.1 putative nucleotidyltransferase [Aquibacillus albus]
MVTNLSKEFLNNHSIYHIFTGSTAYGLANKESDIDQKAFVILPANYLLTRNKEWETQTFHDPDIEFHSLKKAINLLNGQNPTVLETLFVPDRFIIKQSSEGKKLREHRHLFLSQNCFYSFGGYAKDQLMRIKNGIDKAEKKDKDIHLKHVLEQMLFQMKQKYPSLKSGIFQVKDVFRDDYEKQQVNFDIRFDNISLTEINGIVSELSTTYRNYNKKISHQSKKSEAKLFKHAMHLFRLLLMGIEVLKTGELNVYREKDRDFLLNIRNKKYEWDELFAMADDLFLQLEEAKRTSILPEKTDAEKIDQFYFKLISEHYNL